MAKLNPSHESSRRILPLRQAKLVAERSIAPKTAARRREVAGMKEGHWVPPSEALQIPVELPYHAFPFSLYSSHASNSSVRDSEANPVAHREDTTWNSRDDILSRPLPVISFHFLETFTVRDRHVFDLIERGPLFYASLEDFRAGSLDTGLSHFTQASVVALARNCPALKQVRLVGTFRLAKDAIATFLENCPDLDYLEISGSADNPGKIKSPFTQNLINTPGYAPKLQKLVLWNQGHLSAREIDTLTKKRQGLEVAFGSTKVGDQHSMVSWCGSIDNLEYPTKFLRPHMANLVGVSSHSQTLTGVQQDSSAVKSETALANMNGIRHEKEIIVLSDDSDRQDKEPGVIVLSDDECEDADFMDFAE